MARMPGAEWTGEHSPRRSMKQYDIVCIHTIVGYAPAHAAHFSVKADGGIIQSRDTRYQSGANLHGNDRIIAIENEDHGGAFGDWDTRDGHAVPALTEAQVEANAEILAWAHLEHGVPLQLCPNSRPGSQGLGYHRQGIDGNWSSYDYPGRVSGGEVWTNHYGKVCPGDARIAQRDEILARARRKVNGESMSWDEQIESNVRPDGDESAEKALARTRRDAYRTRRVLLYSGSSNQNNKFAQASGVRRIDNPMHPGDEDAPEFDKPVKDQRRASWRWAVERIWKNTWWTLVRTRRIEAMLQGFIDAQEERVRQAVDAALIEHDKRVVQVDIALPDDNEDESDPDSES